MTEEIKSDMTRVFVYSHVLMGLGHWLTFIALFHGGYYTFLLIPAIAGYVGTKSCHKVLKGLMKQYEKVLTKW